VTPIRVAVVDDERVVRDAVAELIEGEETMELVGTAGDARGAIRLAADEHPHVMLLDVRMPGGGVAAAAEIHRRSPLVRIVALSAYGDRGTVLDMVRAGAAGYVAKGALATEILNAVHRAARGQSVLSAEISTTILGELAGHLEAQERAECEGRERERRIRDVIDDPAALRVVLQPIFDLSAARPVGTEALSRFSGPPTRQPDEWFDEAAAANLRLDLELVAARAAVAHLATLPHGHFLSINVSPETLLEPRLHEVVSASAQHIVLEVTEHAPVDDYARLSGALSEFRAAGGRLAIDDAGAGFASLRHILLLDPDFIKLDRTLTSRIDDRPAQRALAKALISFASEIGARIVAEGIETTSELEALRGLGVPFGQGYLLGRPEAPTAPAA